MLLKKMGSPEISKMGGVWSTIPKQKLPSQLKEIINYKERRLQAAKAQPKNFIRLIAILSSWEHWA